LRSETELVLFAPVTGQVIFGGTTLSLQVVQVRREVSIASEFALRATHKLCLLLHLEVKSTS